MFEYDRLALDVAQQFSAPTVPHLLTKSDSQNALDLSKSSSQNYQQQFQIVPAKSAENRCEEPTRRLSGGSTLSFSEFLDCGASSGYVNKPQAKVSSNQLATSPFSLGQHFGQKNALMFGGNTEYERENIDQGDLKDPLDSWDTFSCSLPRSPPPVTALNGLAQQTPRFSASLSRASSVTTQTGSDTTTTVTDVTAVPAAAVEDGFSPNEITEFAQLLCSPKKAPSIKYQCHICYQTGQHYISDCPLRFNSPYEELTPYQGRKKCYGEFQCQQCKRKWTSQNSVANEAQSCIKCHVPVFPHKQLPVDKAVALGLVKSQRVVPTKISPIGSGRPESQAAAIQQLSHGLIRPVSQPIVTPQPKTPVASAIPAYNTAIGVGGARFPFH
ncbi:zinc-binding domain-containing protein [Ditylenchus destructor]|uniref:Zinc-binding domain-containing protein n=1 Tax=Ditylenchus destructor TaxID=166010 RepID=A0AAD4NDH7_9BILA|nr:zinc-binding domain-containing protein [Ditylenchus destructor]